MAKQEASNGGLPIVVHVALLPSNPTEEAYPPRAQASVDRYNASGDILCASEYTKYLVEVCCPDQLLLPLMERARSTNGVLKLCYGCGYETTIVIGNANADAPPTGQVAVGISTSTPESARRGLLISGAESVWTHIKDTCLSHEEHVCLYVSTSNQRLMIPSMPDEELRKRRKNFRVWKDAHGQFLERMQEIPQDGGAAVASRPSGGVASSAAHPSDSTTEEASKKLKAKETKKRAASTDETSEDGPPKKKAKEKKDPTKPKKPMTLYNIYQRENRSRVAAANPDAKFGDVVSLVIVLIL